jgi:hypothetical protein
MARKPAVLKDRTGSMYVMPSYAETIAQQIFTFGSYERDTVKAIISFLPKRGTFIDIAANIDHSVAKAFGQGGCGQDGR